MSSIYRVLHIITDLGQGGAEAVLYRLIGATSDGFEHAVVSLHQEGVYGQPLRDRGISVAALGMPRGRVSIEGLRRLRRIIRRISSTCRADAARSRQSGRWRDGALCRRAASDLGRAFH